MKKGKKQNNKNKNLIALKSYWTNFNTKQYYNYLKAIQL